MNLLKEQCKRCGGLFDALPGTVYCASCNKDSLGMTSLDWQTSSTKPQHTTLSDLTDKQIKLIEHARMFGGEVLGVTVHIKFPINSCTISPDGKTNWIKE